MKSHMKRSKRDKLRNLGYRVAATQKFIGLSDGEMVVIDMKTLLIEKLKATRRQINRG